MKPEDFEEYYRWRGSKRIYFYRHIENGKKREQLIADVISGEVSKSEFAKLQEKMRGRSGYLKYIFSETEYKKAIATPITNEDNLK
ncbi:MAG: hypothetical protein IPO40_24480 [Fibrobacteres bacterium]|nr:hypothetical protein [Fibrobacterota bacterium]